MKLDIEHVHTLGDCHDFVRSCIDHFWDANGFDDDLPPSGKEGDYLTKLMQKIGTMMIFIVSKDGNRIGVVSVHDGEDSKIILAWPNPRSCKMAILNVVLAGFTYCHHIKSDAKAKVIHPLIATHIKRYYEHIESVKLNDGSQSRLISMKGVHPIIRCKLTQSMMVNVHADFFC